MLDSTEVQKLAALARITVSDGELSQFTKEFDAILAYVGQLEEAKVTKSSHEKPALRNVMREDGEPRASGTYTERLVEQFPARKGNALSVKQIIEHD